MTTKNDRTNNTDGLGKKKVRLKGAHTKDSPLMQTNFRIPYKSFDWFNQFEPKVKRLIVVDSALFGEAFQSLPDTVKRWYRDLPESMKERDEKLTATGVEYPLKQDVAQELAEYLEFRQKKWKLEQPDRDRSV